jgi:hypothetical protein
MYIIARDNQERRAKRNLEIRKKKHKNHDVIFKVDDLVLYWEPAQKAEMTEDDKRPDKWTPKWTGPYKITQTTKGDNTTRYHFYHDGRKTMIETAANKLKFYEPWSPGILSTSFDQDITRKFRCGEWVEPGSLVIVPLLNKDCPFAIAKLLSCNKNGRMHLQWYGNDYNDPMGTHLPGWWTPKIGDNDQESYFRAAPKHISHEKFTAEDSGVVMHQRDVLLHNFELTQEGRIPPQLQKKLIQMPDIDWTEEMRDTALREAACAR